ncbi:MAG: adenylate kinase [Gammaproteobacteria bacterium]|nr:MAG: adenylate kinase [Gammaproteobacteria bacterium]
MRTVLLGAPGSGKGTQGVVLSKKYDIPQISTGDLLRAAVAAGSELGKQAKTAMDAGALVSDEIVIGLIRERISHDDAKNGYILDGFPRNIAQAEALDSMLEELSQPLQGVVLLDVAFEELLQRLTGRRTCKDCGAIYNVHLSPAKVEDHCDDCNGPLLQRADDNEATIGNRLNVYTDQTAPLIGFYQAQNKLHTIAGVGNVDDITAAVSSVFDTI